MVNMTAHKLRMEGTAGMSPLRHSVPLGNILEIFTKGFINLFERPWEGQREEERGNLKQIAPLSRDPDEGLDLMTPRSRPDRKSKVRQRTTEPPRCLR